MKIINLTQHVTTAEQREAGIADLPDTTIRQEVASLLTFEELPQEGEVFERASALADIAVALGARAAMIGGAPFLMPSLAAALTRRGVSPCFAFSRRESVEETLPDGSVRKVAVFRHAGLVWAS